MGHLFRALERKVYFDGSFSMIAVAERAVPLRLLEILSKLSIRFTDAPWLEPLKDGTNGERSWQKGRRI